MKPINNKVTNLFFVFAFLTLLPDIFYSQNNSIELYLGDLSVLKSTDTYQPFDSVPAITSENSMFQFGIGLRYYITSSKPLILRPGIAFIYKRNKGQYAPKQNTIWEFLPNSYQNWIGQVNFAVLYAFKLKSFSLQTGVDLSSAFEPEVDSYSRINESISVSDPTLSQYEIHTDFFPNISTTGIGPIANLKYELAECFYLGAEVKFKLSYQYSWGNEGNMIERFDPDGNFLSASPYQESIKRHEVLVDQIPSFGILLGYNFRKKSSAE